MKVNELFGAWETWNTNFIVNGEELSDTELARDEREIYTIDLDNEIDIPLTRYTLSITTE